MPNRHPNLVLLSSAVWEGSTHIRLELAYVPQPPYQPITSSPPLFGSSNDSHYSDSLEPTHVERAAAASASASASMQAQQQPPLLSLLAARSAMVKLASQLQPAALHTLLWGLPAGASSRSDQDLPEGAADADADDDEGECAVTESIVKLEVRTYICMPRNR